MSTDAGALVAIRRSLVSVSDPTGLIELGRSLAAHKVDLLATEGTRRRLAHGGVESRAAEEVTGIASWFGGRIKTLHANLLGAILAPRTPDGEKELAAHGLKPIDLVVVNFYPFARRLKESATGLNLEESIDIGGVTLARAAAKNHASVAVLTDPSQYAAFTAELDRSAGAVSAATRLQLAVDAYRRTAEYDSVIAGGLAGPGGERTLLPESPLFRREAIRLRYGENPHQAAAVYRLETAGAGGPPPFELLKGEALSFTNLLDVDTALATVSEFTEPAAAVVKHATAVGVATATSVGEALAKAVATDPVARYGCVVAVNQPVRPRDLDALHGVFVDLLAAPEVEDAAREALEKRPKLKLLRVSPPRLDVERWEAHSALGRLLLQQADRRELLPSDLRLVTTQPARPDELAALDFAWRVVRHAKSNAIVLAAGATTVGIGSGQPTRVKAVELAVGVAGLRARGSVLASDAFFPFADGVEVAGEAGVRAIIQPGGSVRDAEVIAAAERYGMSMYCTGWRVFRH